MLRSASTVMPLMRARLRFAREGESAALSHLQQIDAIRRALENSSWPVSRTQAKRPKLKISFGPAISVGYESEAEYCDLELASRLDMGKAGGELSELLPKGYRLISVRSIPRFFPSLEQSINVGWYQVHSPLLQETLSLWENFWQQGHFPVIKKKAQGDVVVDAKESVRQWRLEGDCLDVQLRIGARKTLKPERLIKAVCNLPEEVVAMGTPACRLQVKRMQLYFEKLDGSLTEP